MSQRETPWCPHQRRGPGGVLSTLLPGLQKDPLRRFVAWAVEALQKPGEPPWAQIPPVLLGEAESGCLHREDLGLKHRREGCPFLGRGERGSGGQEAETSGLGCACKCPSARPKFRSQVQVRDKGTVVVARVTEWDSKCGQGRGQATVERWSIRMGAGGGEKWTRGCPWDVCASGVMPETDRRVGPGSPWGLVSRAGLGRGDTRLPIQGPKKASHLLIEWQK